MKLILNQYGMESLREYSDQDIASAVKQHLDGPTDEAGDEIIDTVVTGKVFVKGQQAGIVFDVVVLHVGKSEAIQYVQNEGKGLIDIEEPYDVAGAGE